MLFKNIIFSSLLALTSAAGISGRAVCGDCPDGQVCLPYGEMGGIFRCQTPRKARDLELEARQGACGECPEGTVCGPYGGLLKCRPVGAEKRAACMPGGDDCPAGQSCVQYGEMGGIYRCE